MAGFSFDFSDLVKRLPADLDKIAKGIKRNERVAVNLAANEYKSDVQAIAPYKKGVYRKSIHVQPETENGAAVAYIGTDAVQAQQLERGGIIRAKNKEFLHWVDDEGNDHFAKEVYQPPKPHWRPAWDQNLAKYQSMMLEQLARGRV